MLSANIQSIEEFLSLVKEATQKKDKSELKGTQKKEIEMWHHWNNNGRKPEHLKPLLDSFKPIIEKQSRMWKRVEMPTSAIDAEFKKQFVNAMKTYDPSRGVQLNTWVQHNLPKASRYVKMYQNFGKIPEQNIGDINKLKQAREHLTDKLGFEPDTHHLADHLGWSKKRVEQMTKENRKDLPASGFANEPAEFMSPKELEAIRLIQYELSPEQRTVYEYTFGMGGKPVLKPGEISKKTGIHPSKVSRIRNSLKTKIQEALQVL